MPCRKVATFEGTAASSGSYTTEAECNQACQEGACCEGTTCTVKPQCQCQCTSGSCCGPDTFTNSNGETGPRCRNESESACTARGGVWRCGVFCVGLQGDQFAGQPLGSGICTSLVGSPSSPVFKGVGTTCSGSPCKCCCINGIADTTKGEQDCIAAGGTVNSYPCNSPSPLAIPITLSLTNYTAPFQSGVGVRSYDFSCIRGSWTLVRGNYWNGVGAGYSFNTQNIGIGFQVTTTGSWSEGYSNTLCTCAVPQIRLGIVACNPDVVVAGPSLNCAATSAWGLSNFVALHLKPAGASDTWFTTGWVVSVPELCSSTFNASGEIYGPGDVQCGTFTLGNPLP